MNLFINMLSSNPQQFFIWIFVVVFSICCHEYAHARVALWQGDPTAADMGHLTLNPLKQMGMISLVMLVFIGIAYGQVPVNTEQLKYRYSKALVSLAGPLTNFILFILFAFALVLADNIGASEAAITLFSIGAVLNIVLFIFNMIPVPPLDGWGVLTGIFPDISLHKSEFIKGLVLCVMLLIFIYFNYIFQIAYAITGYTVNFIQHLTGL